VYATNETVRRWIEEELADIGCAFYFAVSIEDAFNALAEAQGQPIAIDVDRLTPMEFQELQVLSDSQIARGFIALGNVTDVMNRKLRITHTVPRPFGSETLRAIIAELDRR
jgi:predicted ATPase